MRRTLLGIAAVSAVFSLTAQAQKKVSPKENEALMQVQAAAQANKYADELSAITNVLENFKDTKFKPQLLDMAMDAAQHTGDPVQVATWYERNTANDPNDIPARVIYAEVTAGQIRENDLDKGDNVKKVNDLAHKALDLIQSGGTAPAAIPPDQVDGYKKELAGRAWAAIAQAASVDKRPADAVDAYKKAFDSLPNSILAARLSRAYIANKQYDDAIATADKAMAMPDASPQVKTFAQAQKDQAIKLKGAK